MKITTMLLGAALALTSVGAAQAAPFGSGTAAIAILGSPTVTLGATSGTETFAAQTFTHGGTGSFALADGYGTVSGTLDFSDAPGATLTESLPGFLTFTDSLGGSIVFSASSVETLSYSASPSSTSIALYLLGTAGDASLGLTPTPTSVTITSNETGFSAYSASASIANPPSISAAPEPSTWALMLAGVFGIGLALRQSNRQRNGGLVQARAA